MQEAYNFKLSAVNSERVLLYTLGFDFQIASPLKLMYVTIDAIEARMKHKNGAEKDGLDVPTSLKKLQKYTVLYLCHRCWKDVP